MKIKFNAWSLLLKLPDFIKSPILRQVVSYPSDIDSSLRFKVAETKEELEQAFKLLHDAYVHEKLMDPHPSGLRVTKYHALPSTTTLIAVENDVVIGTVSLIRQSAFGMPLNSIFDLSHLPAKSRIAEVSSLAIKKDKMHQRGRILFPLMKFLLHYSHDYFGVTHFAIAVNPKWIDFYKSILCFKSISKKQVDNYSFVNGAPALGAVLNLDTFPAISYKVYGHRNRKRNLHSFFHMLERKNMEFPLRKKSIISDPILTPDLFHYFFIEKTDCLNTMTDKERYILREMYSDSAFQNLIPSGSVIPMHTKRISKRYETSLDGRLLLPQGRTIPLEIHTVSQHGLGGFMIPTDLESLSTFKVLVNIEDQQHGELNGKFVRLKETGEFGFFIEKSNQSWTQFIEFMEKRMIQLTSGESESPLEMTLSKKWAR